MTIKAYCRGCDKTYQVKGTLAGKRGKCPQGHVLVIPNADPSSNDPAPPQKVPAPPQAAAPLDVNSRASRTTNQSPSSISGTAIASSIAGALLVPPVLVFGVAVYLEFFQNITNEWLSFGSLCVSLPISAAAIILGVVGAREIRSGGGRLTGRAFAIGGICTGCLVLLLIAVVFGGIIFVAIVAVRKAANRQQKASNSEFRMDESSDYFYCVSCLDRA